MHIEGGGRKGSIEKWTEEAGSNCDLQLATPAPLHKYAIMQIDTKEK